MLEVLHNDILQYSALHMFAVLMIEALLALNTAIDQIIAPLERSSVRPFIPWVGEKN